MNMKRMALLGLTTAALLSAGGFATAATPIAPPTPTRLAPLPPQEAFNPNNYMHELIRARHMLNDAKVIIEKEQEDKANFRKETIAEIEKAVNNIGREIDELHKALPAKK